MDFGRTPNWCSPAEHRSNPPFVSLAPGSRLGHYKILALLGAGGMGEVYRASDTRLGRAVAVKIVPGELASNPEARARFAREARAASALNHPHICTVHDVGREGDVDYLVMELLDGETLAVRLRRGPLPLDLVLRYGTQIADALRRAHANGITHRDLKPANVMLTKDGAKLLDFGLAGRRAAAASGSGETKTLALSGPLTEEGSILGTVQYMAPEQLQGNRVDGRADLWALGALLYEMATGKPAFHAANQASLIASIMHDEPGPVRPVELERVVHGLMAKDPNDRIQSAQDVKLQLGWVGAGTPAAVEAARRRPWLDRHAAWVAAALVLAVGAATFILGRRTGPSGSSRSEPPLHSIVPLPQGTYLAGWSSPAVALSRDGRTLAVVATAADNMRRLYLQRLDRDETLLVPGSEEAEGPMFSPDGQWVAFAVGVSRGTRTGELLKYSLSTGLTQSVCALADYFGGQWLPDGRILLVENMWGGLKSVSSEGGTLKSLMTTFLVNGKETERRFRWPQLLPGGRDVIGLSSGKVCVVNLRTREFRETDILSGFARYSPTGHLLYAAEDSTLMVAPFDPKRGVVTGQGVAVLRGISVTANGASVFALSENGTLVYGVGPVRGSGNEISNIVRVTRRGEIRTLPIEPAIMTRCALAPDGRRLAVGSNGEIWIYDLERGTRYKLPVFDADDRNDPVWSPDGRSVAFRALQDSAAGYDLFVQPADGRSKPLSLGGTPAEDIPGSFTPDGRTLLFGTFDSQANGKSAIWGASTDGRKSLRQLSSGSNLERTPRISPDGRSIAYEGTESGRVEVLQATFPEFGTPAPVSASAAIGPRWSRDGRELFFMSGGRMWVVPIQPGPEPGVGDPRPLFDLPGIYSYDVLPDNTGFIGLRADPEAGKERELHVVANWFAELGRLPAQEQ
jgi:eukaryotic-like serine/threonine-protein kinase